VTLTAVTDEQIRAWVVDGNRPPLDAIKGHAGLVSFAKRRISQCWHKSPDERPTFNSKHDNVPIYSRLPLRSFVLEWQDSHTRDIFFITISGLSRVVIRPIHLKSCPNFLLASDLNSFVCIFVRLYCHCFDYNAVAM